MIRPERYTDTHSTIHWRESGPDTDAGQSIRIYPDPDESEFFVGMDPHFSVTVSIPIVAMNGKIFWRRAVEKSSPMMTHHLDLTGLSGGVYIISASDEDSREVDRIALLNH